MRGIDIRAHFLGRFDTLEVRLALLHGCVKSGDIDICEVTDLSVIDFSTHGDFISKPGKPACADESRWARPRGILSGRLIICARHYPCAGRASIGSGYDVTRTLSHDFCGTVDKNTSGVITGIPLVG